MMMFTYRLQVQGGACHHHNIRHLQRESCYYDRFPTAPESLFVSINDTALPLLNQPLHLTVILGSFLPFPHIPSTPRPFVFQSSVASPYCVILNKLLDYSTPLQNKIEITKSTLAGLGEALGKTASVNSSTITPDTC